jgi:nicotinamide mononucleotide (NMN) deamidase PncC
LWVGLALPNHETTATLLRMPGTRDQMRQMSVISALDLLRRRII